MNRPIGIYYAYWEKEWNSAFIPHIKKAAHLGFDLLEIHGGASAEMSSAERKDVIAAAADAGIGLSFGIGLPPDRDVSSLDEQIRTRGVSFMIEVIKAVSEMGGKMIGGTVHSCWPSTLPAGMEDKKPILKQSLKSMKELVKAAEDCDVMLNVEVINRFEQFLLNTCEEAVHYVQAVDNPYCRILLDTFHMNIEEDSISGAIRHAGSYLAALHLGEPNRKPPGCGRMPWAEIKDALDDIGFTGPLVMEPFIRSGGQVGRDIAVWRDVMPGADLDEEAAKAVRFVREYLL